MTDEVYTFLSLFRSHLFDSVSAERRPHVPFVCVKAVSVQWKSRKDWWDSSHYCSTGIALLGGTKYGDAFGASLSPNRREEKIVAWIKAELSCDEEKDNKRSTGVCWSMAADPSIERSPL